MANNNDSWGSKIGVILAVAGSAVGLGNFLRFPGQVATHGGGIFMIPYFISLLLVGIPICWAEWAMGRYGGAYGHNSTPGIFRALWRHPVSKYIGILSITIPVVIYMYYIYVEVWCLNYAYEYMTGGMHRLVAGAAAGQDAKIYSDYFTTLVGANQEYGFPGAKMMVLTIIVFAMNFYLIFRGISAGIEAFSKIAMPLLILIAIIIVVRVLTLGTPDPAMPTRNVVNALGFMWNPKIEGGSVWKSLMNGELWLSAAGQIFFTLSICMGVILNYASYLKRDDDVVLSGLTASSVNEFCEVCLGGMMVVPLAYMFLDIQTVKLDSTFSLGFTVLPTVFHRMPWGDLFGAMLFFMLFIAAITSTISMLQPAIAFLEEGFAMGRRVSVLLLALIVSIGALIVIFFRKNLVALDTMDFWVGNFLVFVLGMIQIILFSWVFGVERGKRELLNGAEIPVPRPFWFIVKYISPVYLLAIFAGFCYKNLPNYIDAIRRSADREVILFVLAFIVGVALFFGLLIWLAGKRWEEKYPISEEDVIP